MSGKAERPTREIVRGVSVLTVGGLMGRCRVRRELELVVASVVILNGADVLGLFPAQARSARRSVS